MMNLSEKTITRQAKPSERECIAEESEQ